MSSRPRPLAAVSALLLAAAITPAAVPARPNIVVILADDMGYSDIGSYGGEIATPSLDGLARRGVRFTQFYVTPRCSTTRAALLTGLYPNAAGIGHLNRDWGRPGYRGELRRDVPTVAELLRAAGYRTYMSGKWHVAHNPLLDGTPPSAEERRGWPRARGFDRFFGTIRGSGSYYHPAGLVRDDAYVEPGEGFYYTDAITSEAVRFLSEHQADEASRPFFLYLAYTAPHWPMHAPEEAVRRVAGRYDAGWDVLRQARYQRMVEMGLVRQEWPLAPLDAKAKPWQKERHQAWQARRMEVYAAMVERMDRGIGRVLATLEAAGTLDDTLIVFLSDNGACREELRGIYRVATALLLPRVGIDRWRLGDDDPEILAGPADTFQTYGPGWSSLSNTPFRRHKHATHEGGIATPLIVHWPLGLRPEPGSLIRAPGHVVDLLPTLLEVAAAPYPARFGSQPTRPLSGDSLLTLLRGGARHRRPMFFEHEGNRAVREGKWKLVSDWPGGWELYDLEADRTELHNLAARQPARVAAMALLFDDFAARSDIRSWPWVARPFRRVVQGAGGLLLALVVILRWRANRRARLRTASDAGAHGGAPS